MTEESSQTHVYNITAQSVTLAPKQHVGNINIKDSQIQEIRVAENTEASGALQNENNATSAQPDGAAVFEIEDESPSKHIPGMAQVQDPQYKMKFPTAANTDTSQREVDAKDETLPPTTSPLDRFLASKRAKIERLENELDACLKQLKMEDHSRILNELRTLRQVNDFETALEFAEYDLFSKTGNSYIDRVKQLAPAAGIRSALDIRSIAYGLALKGECVRAIILFIISHEWHKNEETAVTPDEELTWLSDRFFDIQCSVNTLLAQGGTSRDIAKEYGIKTMGKLLQEFLEVANSNANTVTVTPVQVCRFCDFLYVNLKVGEFAGCIEIGEAGMAMTKRQMGDRAQNYKFFGMFAHNLGKVYFCAGDFSKAEQYYVIASAAHKTATDYKSEKERKAMMKATKQQLDYIRKNVTSEYCVVF